MPIGLLLLKWENDTGPKMIASYPAEFPINPDILRNIFANHQNYSMKSGFAVVSQGSYRILSYFAGSGRDAIWGESSDNHLLALILRNYEDAASYRLSLRSAVNRVFNALNSEDMSKFLVRVYKEIIAV